MPYERRTLLKHFAGLAVTATTSRFFLSSSTGSTNDLNPHAPEQSFFPPAKDHLDVIAHRGGDGQWPGETMYAMRRAVEAGVDVLEMDVYLTRDKEQHLVLMHNNRAGRTTELDGIRGLLPVHSFELDELQKLNAAYRWSPDGVKIEFPRKFSELPNNLKPDLRVPTLKEVFKTFPQMRMNIEMKDAGKNSPARALDSLIRECEMTDKVLVASLVHDYLTEFRSFKNKVATSASLKEAIAYAFQGTRPSADAIQIGPEFLTKLPHLTPRLIEQAHRDTLLVHSWTTNDLKEMSRMRSLGVNGIITDYPGPLLALLNRMKRA